MIKIIILQTLLSASIAFAGQEIGNGGDALLCTPSTENTFSGTYALDYILTYQTSNLNQDIVSSTSIQESLLRIARLLKKKAPELVADFADFMVNIQNKNLAEERIWEEAPFGLVDLKDENMISLVPNNCRSGDVVKIVQAVIRQEANSTGLAPGKILYRYVPSVYQQLETQNPVQLSFLLVHEWLWDISSNVDRNRRVNRFFHSDALEKLSKDQVHSALTSLGLEIPSEPGPPAYGVRCRCVAYDRMTGQPYHEFNEFSCKLALKKAWNTCLTTNPHPIDCTDLGGEKDSCLWLAQ